MATPPLQLRQMQQQQYYNFTPTLNQGRGRGGSSRGRGGGGGRGRGKKKDGGSSEEMQMPILKRRLETPEEIAAWIAERKSRFPTKDNVEKKKVSMSELMPFSHHASCDYPCRRWQ